MKGIHRPDAATLLENLAIELLELRGKRRDATSHLSMITAQNQIDILHFNLSRLRYMIHNFNELKLMQVNVVRRSCKALIHNYQVCVQTSGLAINLIKKYLSTHQNSDHVTVELNFFLQSFDMLNKLHLTNITKFRNFEIKEMVKTVPINDPLQLLECSFYFTTAFKQVFDGSINDSQCIEQLYKKIKNLCNKKIVISKISDHSIDNKTDSQKENATLANHR